jgi:hypothetical protein
MDGRLFGRHRRGGPRLHNVYFQPDVNLDLAIAQIVSATNAIRALMYQSSRRRSSDRRIALAPLSVKRDHRSRIGKKPQGRTRLNSPERQAYLILRPPGDGPLGTRGVVISCDPLTLPAGPGAIRPPPGPIRSISVSLPVAAPGAIGTLPGPIPPSPTAGRSAPGATGLVGKVCANADVASARRSVANALAMTTCGDLIGVSPFMPCLGRMQVRLRPRHECTG